MRVLALLLYVFWFSANAQSDMHDAYGLGPASKIITFPDRFCNQFCFEILPVNITDPNNTKYTVIINVSTPGTLLSFHTYFDRFNVTSSDNTTNLFITPFYGVGVGTKWHTTTLVFNNFNNTPIEPWFNIDSVFTFGPFYSALNCSDPIDNATWSPDTLVPSLLILYPQFVLIQIADDSTPEKTCLDVGTTITCLIENNTAFGRPTRRNTPLCDNKTSTALLSQINSSISDIIPDKQNFYNKGNWLNAAPFDFKIYTSSFLFYFWTEYIQRTVISYALCTIDPPSTNITSSNDTAIISASPVPHPTIINTTPVYSGKFTSSTTDANGVVIFNVSIPYSRDCSELLLYKDSLNSPGVFDLYAQCDTVRLTTCYSFSSNDQLTCTLSVSVQDNGIGDTDGRLTIVSDAYSVVIAHPSSPESTTTSHISSSEGIDITIILTIVLFVLTAVFVIGIISILLVRITKYKSVKYQRVPST